MRTFERSLLGCVVVAAWLGGCATEGAPTAEDRARAEENLAVAVQALGEPACGTLTADRTWDATGTSIPTATDTNYGQNGCAGGYIIDATGLRAGQRLRGGSRPLPAPFDEFSCLFTWGYISLWEKDGDAYVLSDEAAALGEMRRMIPQPMCDPKAELTVPADGDYRIVVAGGFFFFPLPAQVAKI